MIIALNSDNQRIQPFPGARGSCQICESELVAHCGVIYIWHWQHKIDRDCDPWKEHETEWHRSWKSRFPEQWQETVITNDNGEKHLADVRTENGLVIEFQNSPISAPTIEIREEFYESMLWVINAKEFKKNLKIWSAVNSGLRRIDKNVIERLVEIEDEINDEIKVLSEALDDLERRRAEKFSDLKFHENKSESLACYLADVDDLSSKVIEYWSQVQKSMPNFFVMNLCSELNIELKQNLLTIQSEMSGLNNEREILHIKKAFIDSKVDFEYDGKLLKIIAYAELSKSNYHKAICVKKDTFNTLFKNVEKVTTDLEFLRLKYNEHEYVFAIDPSDAYSFIETKDEELRASFHQMETRYDEIVASIKRAVSELIDFKLKELKKVIETESNEDEDLLAEISTLRIRLETKKMSKKEKVDLAEKHLKEEVKADRFEIMRKRKGLYSYNWKHERTTWRFANKPIYFDFGDGFLFRKISDGQFLKISVEDFVKVNKLKNETRS